MPRIVCEAHNCRYNKNTYCEKKCIDIKGVCAADKCDTECGSFEQGLNKGIGNMFSAEFASFDERKNETKVNCSNTNCCHNRSRLCCNNMIKINGNEAKSCCETFCDCFCSK